MEFIKKLRIRFALNAMIIAAIILLVLFGTIYGLLWSNDLSNESRILDDALSKPQMPGGKEDLVYVFTADGETVVMSNATIFQEQYGSDANPIIFYALQTENGRFAYNGMHFAVKTKVTASGKTYALHDRTSRYDQLIIVLIETLAIYCAAVALIFVIAYLFSAKTLKPVADTYVKQRDLIANASHELKTPLTVISTDLSVVKSEPESTVQDNAKWLESIDKQIARMQDLIGNMLELSKLEQTELPKTILDFSEIVDGVCLEFEAVCFEKGATLVTDAQQGVKVLGDKNSLERLVAILLDNAIKYCGENGKVGCRLYVDGKKATLEVLNTGAVISEEDAQHVFDRFYRTDGARQNDDGKSFGLGLSIAAATVRAHSGTITCRGVENKGTVFTVALPMPKKSQEQS